MMTTGKSPIFHNYEIDDLRLEPLRYAALPALVGIDDQITLGM